MINFNLGGCGHGGGCSCGGNKHGGDEGGCGCG